ncbi:MAG: flagellar export chaperone FlgN [Clostridia bacterium]|nr:flagellar export chaperone FlgN [Clostridia bacterium]
MDKFHAFKSLMKEYDDLLEELIELEEDKIDAVSEDDLEFLQDCLRAEEAGMMRMRGLDVRREKLMKEMNFAGMTFRDILNEMAAVQRKELQPLFNSIVRSTDIFRKLTASIQTMLESKTLANERKLAFMQGHGDGVNTSEPARLYDKNGETVEDRSFTRSKTV